MSWVYFLKSKEEAATVIEHFVNMVECQFSATILSFKTDNGGEYINNRKQHSRATKVFDMRQLYLTMMNPMVYQNAIIEQF